MSKDIIELSVKGAEMILLALKIGLINHEQASRMLDDWEAEFHRKFDGEKK